VSFSLAAARENAQRVHPGVEIVEVSCVTGQGLPAWRAWLDERLAQAGSAVAGASR
jgi:hydrogenase nickel incorporation protein HypB